MVDLNFLSDKKINYEAEHCHCGIDNEYPTINSYCKKWFSNLNESICLLKNRSKARFCNGARNLKGTDIYVTSDESICNASMCKGDSQLRNLNERWGCQIKLYPRMTYIKLS